MSGTEEVEVATPGTAPQAPVEKKQTKKSSKKRSKKVASSNDQARQLQMLTRHQRNMTDLLDRQARETVDARRRHAQDMKRLQRQQAKDLERHGAKDTKDTEVKPKAKKQPREYNYAHPDKPLRDWCSYARPTDAVISHFHLDLTADFKRSVLSGHCDLTVNVVKKTNHVVLDTKSLNISAVKDADTDTDLKFTFGKPHEAFGRLLRIRLGEGVTAGTQKKVRVVYETTPESSAIQWLPAEQTAGKAHPYLFTQCQAIHARTMFPCQDTPQVKCTYSARIVVPAPLTALMSAISVRSETQESEPSSIAYYFEQKVPIPSYLCALAIGLLEKRDISPRCAVWSEKEFVDAAAYEFEDTEEFLSIGERIAGPYVWGRYDVLLLPPSFPYGGMENPCLTFVTPTLLAGDKSNANVVAHEISHSWMGNLVTSETWEHFWMNEGFTVYLERKICKAMHGNEMMHLDAMSGWKALTDAVDRYGHKHNFTKLNLSLRGVDPDDAFSSIPYEKGFNFLFYLESLLGEEAMNGLLKAHCEEFKFKTVNTYKWKAFFLSHFAHVGNETLGQIDWKMWMHEPGMPPKPAFNTALADASHALAAAIAAGQTGDELVDISSWSTAQVVCCLEKLLEIQAEDAQDSKSPSSLSASLASVEGKYHFADSKNCEIRFRWLTLCVRAGIKSVFPAAVTLLTEQGRMKYIRPLYRDLFAAGEEGKALAIATFQEHRSMYHLIASTMVAKDLQLA